MSGRAVPGRGRPARALRRMLAGAAIVQAGLAVLPAGAQTRLSVDASASGGVATNPYLTSGSSPTAITATVDLRPSVTYENTLTTLRLDGDAQVTFYDKRYSANESVNLVGSGTHQLSERTSLNGAVSYLNTITGSYNDIRVPVGGPVVDTNLPVFVNDPTLGVFGRRQQSVQVSGGLQTALSPRDSIGANVSSSINRYGGGGISDFNYVAPSVFYRRALGERFDVGVSMSVGFSNYLGTSVGDATVYQPSMTVNRTFSNGWSLAAAAGAGIANLQEPGGRTSTSTSFNGSLALCRRDDRWNLCLNGSRETVPSSFQGLRTQNSINVSAGYRASPRDDVSVYAGYSSASTPLQDSVIGGVRGRSSDYASASGNLSHRFSPVFSGFVSAGFNKGFDDGFQRDANITAQVGVSYRFGQRK